MAKEETWSTVGYNPPKRPQNTNLEIVQNAKPLDEDDDLVEPTEETSDEAVMLSGEPVVVMLSSSASDAEVAAAQAAADAEWRAANPGKPLVRAANPRLGGER